MRAAINRVDVVGKTEHALGIAVVVLNAYFHRHAVSFGFHVDRLVVKNRLAAVEMLDKFRDAAVVLELRRLRFPSL